MFVEVTGEKLVGGPFPLPLILDRVSVVYMKYKETCGRRCEVIFSMTIVIVSIANIL